MLWAETCVGKGKSDREDYLYFWGQVAKVGKSTKFLQAAGHFQRVSFSLGAPSGTGQVKLRNLHGSFLGTCSQFSLYLSLPGHQGPVLLGHLKLAPPCRVDLWALPLWAGWGRATQLAPCLWGWVLFRGRLGWGLLWVGWGWSSC